MPNYHDDPHDAPPGAQAAPDPDQDRDTAEEIPPDAPTPPRGRRTRPTPPPASASTSPADTLEPPGRSSSAPPAPAPAPPPPGQGPDVRAPTPRGLHKVYRADRAAKRSPLFAWEHKAAQQAEDATLPPTVRTRLPNDPFFARITGVDLECPQCGALATFTTTLRGKVKQSDARTWDPQTQTFSCPTCGRAVQLGILAWTRVAPSTRVVPPDIVPTPRQASRLRQLLTAGYWARGGLTQRKARVNAILDDAPHTVCRCDPETQTAGWPVPHPSCPLHGPLGRQTEDERVTQARARGGVDTLPSRVDVRAPARGESGEGSGPTLPAQNRGESPE